MLGICHLPGHMSSGNHHRPPYLPKPTGRCLGAEEGVGRGGQVSHHTWCLGWYTQRTVNITTHQQTHALRSARFKINAGPPLFHTNMGLGPQPLLHFPLLKRCRSTAVATRPVVSIKYLLVTDSRSHDDSKYGASTVSRGKNVQTNHELPR